MGADHNHGSRQLGDHRGRLLVVLAITVAVLIVEVTGAVISGSLALLADAGPSTKPTTAGPESLVRSRTPGAVDLEDERDTPPGGSES